MKKSLLTLFVCVCASFGLSAQTFPAALYLVGDMNTWVLPTEEYILNPTDDAGVYSGIFEIEANKLNFKIFEVNQLNWNNSQLYYGTKYDAVGPVFDGISVEMPIGHGNEFESNITCTNWIGGEVVITVDLNTNVVKLMSETQPVLPEETYMVGKMNSWLTPDAWTSFDKFVLHKTADNPYIFTGVYEIPAGDMEFKVFLAKTNWDNPNLYLGTYEKEKNVYSDAPALYYLQTGQNTGNIYCSNWAGGTATIAFNIANNTVEISGAAQPSKPDYPDAIYLIGAPQGWSIDNGSCVLSLNPDSEDPIYEGVFNIASGQAMFRFYTALGNWSANSIGYQTNDSPTDMILDGTLTTAWVWGQGSWNFPAWQGGRMKISLNYFDQTVTFVDIANEIYLIGSPQGWNIEDGSLKLAKLPGTNKFEGKLNIPADAYLRFYTGLGNWDNGSIGAALEDTAVDISLTDNQSYNGSCCYGKGCWHLENWTGGDISFTVDLADMTVVFTPDMTSSGLSELDFDNEAITLHGTELCFRHNVKYTVADTSGKTVMSGEGDKVDVKALQHGVYVVVITTETGKVSVSKVAL